MQHHFAFLPLNPTQITHLRVLHIHAQLTQTLAIQNRVALEPITEHLLLLKRGDQEGVSVLNLPHDRQSLVEVDSAVQERLEQSARCVAKCGGSFIVKCGGSFIVKNELLMEDRGEILIEAKTKNDNDLREELRLCVKRGRKRDKESECGAVKRRLQCARQKRKVILTVVLHVLNVQVCVGNGVGGFVIDEVVHKTGAHRL